MTRQVFIMRGLPGSGKSTLANSIAPSAVVCSADHYFIDDDGVYRFNPSELPAAHEQCQDMFDAALNNESSVIVVDNTNVSVSHYRPYINKARQFGYSVAIVDVYDGGCSDPELAARNTHGVPLHAISRMRRMYE